MGQIDGFKTLFFLQATLNLLPLFKKSHISVGTVSQ